MYIVNEMNRLLDKSMSASSESKRINSVKVIANAHTYDVIGATPKIKTSITEIYSLAHVSGTLYVYCTMYNVYLVYVYDIDWLSKQTTKWTSIYYPNSETKRPSMKQMSILQIYNEVYRVLPADLLEMALNDSVVSLLIANNDVVISITDPWAYRFILNHHLTNDKSRPNISTLNHELIINGINHVLHTHSYDSASIILIYELPPLDADASPPLMIECSALPSIHTLKTFLTDCFREIESS